MSESPLKSLNEYMNKVFDANGDGKVSVKEFLHRISHSAPALAIIVVDLLVIAAEIRVWDMGMTMTKSGWKAIGFVLISAVPFYLAQALWIYPRGNTWQKIIAVGIGVGGLGTSAMFGRADLFLGYDLQMDAAYLLNAVILLTAGYILALLFYVLIDPTIRAWFIEIQTAAAVKQQETFLAMTRKAMTDLKKTQKLQKEIEDEFGDPDAVQNHLARLHGQKPNRSHDGQGSQNKADSSHFQPKQVSFSSEEKLVEKAANPPLDGPGSK